MKLGATTISFLLDSEIRGKPGDFFPGSNWGAHRHLLDEHGDAVANVGSFLVRTPSHVMLVDLGLGPGGSLLDNLAAHGLGPADIDLVVFTHLHRDHVGWAGAFPNATYLVDRTEWDYWSAQPGGLGPDADKVLTPVARSLGFLDQLPSGVQAVPTPGHTPGHTCLLITDSDTEGRVLLLGDLLHTRAQFTEPHWAFRADVAPQQARQQRVDVLARYRDDRTVFAGGHFAGTVFGEAEPNLAD